MAFYLQGNTKQLSLHGPLMLLMFIIIICFHNGILSFFFFMSIFISLCVVPKMSPCSFSFAATLSELFLLLATGSGLLRFNLGQMSAGPHHPPNNPGGQRSAGPKPVWHPGAAKRSFVVKVGLTDAPRLHVHKRLAVLRTFNYWCLDYFVFKKKD